jgi:hypothetical protein
MQFVGLVRSEDQQYLSYYPIIDPNIDFVGSEHSFETRCLIAHRIQAICLQIHFVCKIQFDIITYINSLSNVLDVTEDGEFDIDIAMEEEIERNVEIAQEIISNSIQDCYEEFCLFIHLEGLIENSSVFQVIHHVYSVDIEEIKSSPEVNEKSEPAITKLKALFLKKRNEDELLGL